MMYNCNSVNFLSSQASRASVKFHIFSVSLKITGGFIPRETI